MKGYRQIPDLIDGSEVQQNGIEIAWLLGELSRLMEKVPTEYLAMTFTILPEVATDMAVVIYTMQEAMAMSVEFDPEEINAIKEGVDQETAVRQMRGIRRTEIS